MQNQFLAYFKAKAGANAPALAVSYRLVLGIRFLVFVRETVAQLLRNAEAEAHLRRAGILGVLAGMRRDLRMLNLIRLCSRGVSVLLRGAIELLVPEGLPVFRL